MPMIPGKPEIHYAYDDWQHIDRLVGVDDVDHVDEDGGRQQHSVHVRLVLGGLVDDRSPSHSRST